MAIGYAQKTWVIDGTTYRTTVLPASEGRGLYIRLIQAVAPALENLTELKGADGDKVEAVLLRTFIKALGSLPEQLFQDLCEAMALKTVVPRSGGEDSLVGAAGDLHFAGQYSKLLRCVVEFCKANGFLDFFSASSLAGDAPVAKTA